MQIKQISIENVGVFDRKRAFSTGLLYDYALEIDLLSMLDGENEEHCLAVVLLCHICQFFSIIFRHNQL